MFFPYHQGFPIQDPSEKHAVMLVTIAPPSGQEGRLMGENGTGEDNVILPRAELPLKFAPVM